MAWTVRTPEGSLDFETIADVARAYRNGLVGPDDELSERGQAKWRKASAHPALSSISDTTKESRSQTPMLIPTLLAVVLAGAALYCLAIGQWVLGLVLAFAVAASLMRFSRRALAPRRTFSAQRP